MAQGILVDPKIYAGLYLANEKEAGHENRRRK